MAFFAPDFDSGWVSFGGTHAASQVIIIPHRLALRADHLGDDVQTMTVQLSNDGGRTFWDRGACTSSGSGQYGSTVTVDARNVSVVSNAIGGPAYNLALGAVATHIRVRIWSTVPAQDPEALAAENRDLREEIELLRRPAPVVVDETQIELLKQRLRTAEEALETATAERNRARALNLQQMFEFDQKSEQAQAEHRKTSADLQARLEAAQLQHQSEVHTVATERDQNQQAVVLLQDKVQSLENKLASEQAQQRKTAETLQAQIDSLHTRVAQEQENARRLQANSEKQLQEFKTTCERLEREKQELRGNGANVQDAMHDLEAQLQKLRRERDSLRTQFDRIDGEKANMLIRISELQVQNARVTEELDSARAAVRSATVQLQPLQLQLKLQERRCSFLQTELTEQQNRFDRAKADSDQTLREELESQEILLTRRYESCAADLKSSTETCTRLREQLQTAHSALAAMNQNGGGQQALGAETVRQLEELREELVRQQAFSAQQEKTMSVLKDELATKTQRENEQLCALKAQLHEEKRRCLTAESAQSTLRVSLDLQRDETNQLRELCGDANARAETGQLLVQQLSRRCESLEEGLRISRQPCAPEPCLAIVPVDDDEGSIIVVPSWRNDGIEFAIQCVGLEPRRVSYSIDDGPRVEVANPGTRMNIFEAMPPDARDHIFECIVETSVGNRTATKNFRLEPLNAIFRQAEAGAGGGYLSLIVAGMRGFFTFRYVIDPPPEPADMEFQVVEGVNSRSVLLTGLAVGTHTYIIQAEFEGRIYAQSFGQFEVTRAEGPQ
eukprot:gnl/Spiro4/1136_TR598_c0_g1_i1.p1 gnl/Spiro4/1136_TR598_c0_g1~~gnl/Spiro4/1136_TR598_c0_g1_i1.p1  ORF type:complete len:807 (+),score=108.01 gnl/Spiro4/1136_TR598_c0_g1_i1:51-2423(+)